MLPVILELHGLARQADSVGDSAKSALVAIYNAIKNQENLKIINAEGLDLTKIEFFCEKSEKDTEDNKDIDEIIRTTKNVADSRRKETAPQGAGPAVLLTEDGNMHTKAIAGGVSSISTIVLKRHLLTHRSDIKTGSNVKKGGGR